MWRITCLTPVHDSIRTIIRSISIIQYSFTTKQPPLLFPKFTRKMATVGNIREVQGSENDLEHDSLARFAVDHHNTNQNAGLQFHKVVNVKQQTVAGTMYHITLEAADGAQKKVYEAKVWVKPWENFKEVQDFKHIGDAS